MGDVRARCGEGKLEAIEAGLGEDAGGSEGDFMDDPAGDFMAGNLRAVGDFAGTFSSVEGDFISRGDLISGLTKFVWSTLTVS